MLLWYASYGSNLSRDRFLNYLRGGRASGAALRHAGARDRSLPLADMPVRIPGRLHFGITSTTWGGGGVAFYDADGAGEVLARAYLVTQEQFSDVAAQEMHREPGVGRQLDLAAALSSGRHVGGPGHYETVHRVGQLEEAPIVTFTADQPLQIPANPPEAPYLRTLASGLAEAHRLTPEQVADYLVASPAVSSRWSHADLERLAAAA